MTLSGAAHADFNVGVCHGSSIDGLDECLQQIKELGAPAKIMLCGASLGNARRLVDEGWICIRAFPFMVAQLREGAVDPGVRRLSLSELPAFRSLFQSAYHANPSTSELAIPERAGTDGTDLTDDSIGDTSAWGLFADDEMVAGMTTVRVEENLCVFSMATPRNLQRRGYAGRLLNDVLARGAAEGLERALLNSTTAGERLYLSAGFCVLEYWQIWSRSRWVLV
jgi:GNAT superfamily N-acetyltransferase